jgi:transposase
MLNSLMSNTTYIFLACGATDFRKQVAGLVAIVNTQFKLDPFEPTCAFIFCNKRRTSIKVLRYDKNGFILATKKLLEGMKFQWPKDACDIKKISSQQVEWLLQGLEIEQKKALPKIEMGSHNTCY